MSTNKAFIERCVQFEEEPLTAVEVGETSSPPEPLKVSEEFVEHGDSDLSNGYEFIEDPSSPTRPKMGIQDTTCSRRASWGSQ